jgi:hypothetical protein
MNSPYQKNLKQKFSAARAEPDRPGPDEAVDEAMVVRA